MAPPPVPRLIGPGARRAARIAGLALAGLLAIVAAYWLAGWIGSSIPRNADWSPPERGVEIMIESNGTHTGIVVPVIHPHKDWRRTFPSAGQPRQRDGYIPTHLAIGWGEREVFLHVATWGDLSPATALRVALTGGDALLRVSHYVNPQPGEYFRPLTISPAQYARLTERIEAALPPQPPGTARKVLRGTYAPDTYYEAQGRYTLFTTSNTWVGDTLADAGVAMGAWTPFAGGVMKWIPEPNTRPEAGDSE